MALSAMNRGVVRALIDGTAIHEQHLLIRMRVPLPTQPIFCVIPVTVMLDKWLSGTVGL
jgi:hypothetical protein